jgi:hypothetical protein
MADSVSSLDVEDVLSSIRRLVSEETKPTSAQSDDAPTQAAAPIDMQQAGRDLADEMAVPPAANDASAVPAHAQRDPLVLTPALQVAQAPAPVVEPLPLEPETSLVVDVALEALRPPEALEIPQPTEQLVDTLAAASEPETVQDVEIELHPEATHAPDLSPDPSPESMPDPSVEFRRSERPKSDLLEALFEAEPMGGIVDSTESARQEEQTTASGLAAALTSLTGGGRRPKEDAAAEGDPDIDPAVVQAASADLNSAADGDDDLGMSTIDFSEDEDGIMDEEGLRDMIATIVREELQGELGDRITRNVRKLVRREINRALAGREFD